MNPLNPNTGPINPLTNFTPATPTALAMSMPTPLPQAALVPSGLSIPIKLQTHYGEVRLYLQFPAEYAANPQAIAGLVGHLMQMGWPINAWQQDSGYGGSGGFGGGQNFGQQSYGGYARRRFGRY